MIEFKLNNGRLPTKGSVGAAGFDIHSNVGGTIAAESRMLVSTGVFLNRLPPDTYLRIAPRSKLANKHGVDILAGVVDADYRGEIMVILHNNAHTAFTFSAGDAIAQLILEKIHCSAAIEVNDLAATARGATGINDGDVRR